MGTFLYCLKQNLVLSAVHELKAWGRDKDRKNTQHVQCQCQSLVLCVSSSPLLNAPWIIIFRCLK